LKANAVDLEGGIDDPQPPPSNVNNPYAFSAQGTNQPGTTSGVPVGTNQPVAVNNPGGHGVPVGMSPDKGTSGGTNGGTSNPNVPNLNKINQD
jgi:hypothetical protein